MMFEAEVKLMEQVKQGVFAKFQGPAGENVTPAIAGAMRNFDTFCDTTYLWMLQLAEFVKHAGAAREQAAATVEARPGSIPVDLGNQGEAPSA